ncbi:DNA polymerase Y family protein [Raineyella sp. LH-20]|uniref:DNA polymerase Y family protein n=1 Tax=Raineyella sp. LH-20 TaxID=3081204 RepID=UPI0029540AB2|nr:DNA polymerase Y family protein [Raineyella sp. LH-20]WOP17561.1 DNA polymerase Y family protein [Raineyella sp. LH-20]
MTGVPPVRCGVLWFPEWPVTAWAQAEGGGVKGGGVKGGGVKGGGVKGGGVKGGGVERNGADAPVAVVEANRVVSCSAAAQAEGVRRGQRRREAQACCPTLRVVAADVDRDHRLFAPLLDLLEQVSPGVQVIRPGLVTLRMRGPARYYGGEQPAAAALLAAMDGAGVTGVRAGVADGMFTAEQAAYESAPRGPAAEPTRGGAGEPGPICIVPPGAAAEFLAPLPVNRLGDAELAELLPKLGIRRLGEFAALEVRTVRDRFGERGVRLHALAGGGDSRIVQPRTPPPVLTRTVEFSPPLELVDQVAFAVRAGAEDFVAGLAEHQLVCTELRVELTAEEGERAERVWVHPAAFDPAAVVDRVRWQLQAAAGSRITSRVMRVRLEPVAVDDSAHHAPGLFGTGPDERVHHALSRVQAMLGADGVVTAVIGGGRRLAERQVSVPWGDRAMLPLPADRPWPGHLPAPLPATVFEELPGVIVLAADGSGVGVDGRGAVSAPPAVLVEGGRRRPIVAWAGPWPLDEHSWDPVRRHRAHRFQVVDDAQIAWLLVCDDDGGWWAEGRYD